MRESIASADSLVAFHNSQGEEGRGTLMHLTRNTAVFEVYNPFSILQLSEVLKDLRILRGDRAVYSGRAVVSNLVLTGLMLIVSATLVDPWSDLAGLAPGEGLREEVELFVRDWKSGNTLYPAYQVAVANISTFLSELSRWLDQAEVAASVKTEVQSPDMQKEFLEEVKAPLLLQINDLFAVFEKEASQIPPEEIAVHKVFAHRGLHPLLLCAPFVYRSFTKPLGYAGDYEMVNMILRDPAEGPNTYAKIVNSFALWIPPAMAHRNRIAMLVERLQSEARRAAQEGRPLHVLNVGCGPAEEVARFIRTDPLSERCEFHLLDWNEETCSYARDRILAAMRESGRKPVAVFLDKSIHTLLKEATRGGGSQSSSTIMSMPQACSTTCRIESASGCLSSSAIGRGPGDWSCVQTFTPGIPLAAIWSIFLSGT